MIIENRVTYFYVTFLALITCTLYIYGWITQPTDGSTWATENNTVVVRAVPIGSAAHAAGIQIGDKILYVNGHRAEVDFIHQVHYRYYSVGSIVEYYILRNHSLLSISVTLQSMWSTAPLYFLSYYGLIISILSRLEQISTTQDKSL